MSRNNLHTTAQANEKERDGQATYPLNGTTEQLIINYIRTLTYTIISEITFRNYYIKTFRSDLSYCMLHSALRKRVISFEKVNYTVLSQGKCDNAWMLMLACRYIMTA